MIAQLRERLHGVEPAGPGGPRGGAMQRQRRARDTEGANRMQVAASRTKQRDDLAANGVAAIGIPLRAASMKRRITPNGLGIRRCRVNQIDGSHPTNYI
jgi:hypothetical protein